jgi:hypothetical protein
MLVKPLPEDAPDGFEFLKAANSGSVTAANDAPDFEIPDFVHSPSIGTSAEPWLEYPRFYHGRAHSSDRDWILKTMSYIPAEPPKLRHNASLEYERIFLTTKNADRRRKANTWLKGVAKQFYLGRAS